MIKTPIKIGIIGTGNMGRNHLRILNEEKSTFELIGFFDGNPDTAKNLSNTFNVWAAKSAEELMEKVEAVVIALPSSLHIEMALKTAKFGLHTLVEKPLALNVKDAQKICDAYETAGKVLMVGHVERYNPVVIELQKILKDEQIIAVEAHRCSPYDGRISDADVISDLMIHDIDILFNCLLVDPIEKLQAHGKNIVSQGNLDFVQAIFSMKNGIMASVTASRITEDKVRTIDIHTRSAFIRADLLTRTLQITRRTNYTLDTGYTPTYRQENIIEKVMVPMFEPLRKELGTFADCINENKTPPTDGKCASNAIMLAESIRSSC